jgi:formylglycine-generating enzyme required for sulfatase activity
LERSWELCCHESSSKANELSSWANERRLETCNRHRSTSIQSRESRTWHSGPRELHGMAGNVWEWVNDGYSESYYGESPVNDPPGPEPDFPVLRGGAWSAPPNYLRVAYRGNYSPTLQDNLIGFRCAR